MTYKFLVLRSSCWISKSFFATKTPSAVKQEVGRESFKYTMLVIYAGMWLVLFFLSCSVYVVSIAGSCNHVDSFFICYRRIPIEPMHLAVESFSSLKVDPNPWSTWGSLICILLTIQFELHFLFLWSFCLWVVFPVLEQVAIQITKEHLVHFYFFTVEKSFDIERPISIIVDSFIFAVSIPLSMSHARAWRLRLLLLSSWPSLHIHEHLSDHLIFHLLCISVKKNIPLNKAW